MTPQCQTLISNQYRCLQIENVRPVRPCQTGLDIKTESIRKYTPQR